MLRTRTKVPHASKTSSHRRKTLKTQKRSQHTVPTSNNQPKILITGAVGQVGSDLVKKLRKQFSPENIIATDVRVPPADFTPGPFKYLDVMDAGEINKIVVENNITWVCHLASILSAAGEKNPLFALKLNTRGLENVLEAAKVHKLRVFAPSTIAAFGPDSPRDFTPDTCIQNPTTVYGVSKVYLELLGQYYQDKFGVDFRSIRYPGIISAIEPGGGTTDYAVDIFYQALQKGKYTCFLKEDTMMPMMYGDDAIKATYDLLVADKATLKRTTYNVTAVSFTPAQCAASIKKLIPHFEIDYAPDSRQAIADTWPMSLNDTNAQVDFNWKPNLDTMDKLALEMLTAIHGRLIAQNPTIQLHWSPDSFAVDQKVAKC